MLCYVMLCYSRLGLSYAMLCYAITNLCNIFSAIILLYAPCYAKLCYAMYAMVFYAMACYVMVRYVILCLSTG